MHSKRLSATKKPSLKTRLASDITLETYLTHPSFFGLTTATPVQRAKCRIVSGEPLGDLAKNEDVIKFLGGSQALSLLPTKPPLEFLDISASRVAKSQTGAAIIVWLSQTVDVSITKIGDIIRIPVVALKLDGTRAVMTHLLDNILAKPALKALLVDDPKDVSTKVVHLRHPSGRIIEVLPVPLDRAGGSALSVYCAGAVVDEYPRMAGAEDGAVKNIDHFRDGILGRFLPGSVYLSTGSPWQPYGPAYDAVVKHFGKPSNDIIVARTTGPAANPFWWTPERCAELQRKNPLAYKTDCLAEFADGEEAVFPAQAIEDAWNRPPSSQAQYGKPAIFADPSALRHDYWAAMVGGWVHPFASSEDLYETEFLGDYITPGGRGQVVPGAKGWIRILEDHLGRPIPRKDGKALRPHFEVYEVVSWDKNSGARGLDLIKAVGQLGRKYGCESLIWDGYEQLMLSDLVRSVDLRPVVLPWQAGRKTEAVDHLRTLFVERRVRLPQHDLLKQELLRFRARATPGGNFSYVVAGGSGHGDHASCLTLAMRADLDGYVDRSPTKARAVRVEIPDYDETASDFF